MRDVELPSLLRMLRDAGVVRLYAKQLAENDNSKNQIYLAGSFEVLNAIPFGEPRVVTSKKGRKVLHASVPLSWLSQDGSIGLAKNTKLILYPQYPEVRLSGFLMGSPTAPSEVLAKRAPGRVLLLGVTADSRVIACALEGDDTAARELRARGLLGEDVVLSELSVSIDESSRTRLLTALWQVADKGWVDSVRLGADDLLVPCRARNCGGYTLEAYLGIRTNSRSEPDYAGYEVKQFAVESFGRLVAQSPVTLFTPEPSDGVYVTRGVDSFVRLYGYEDRSGRVDRLNFGGRFLINRRASRTGLTMQLRGADLSTGRIHDADGAIELIDDHGVVAAAWSFASLIGHWGRKHANAAYVPSLRSEDATRYRFSSTVFLGQGTDFSRFLRGIGAGRVFYDPGIKIENASSDTPTSKRRSQFRVTFSNLASLYGSFERVELPSS